MYYYLLKDKYYRMNIKKNFFVICFKLKIWYWIVFFYMNSISYWNLSVWLRRNIYMYIKGEEYVFLIGYIIVE